MCHACDAAAARKAEVELTFDGTQEELEAEAKRLGVRLAKPGKWRLMAEEFPELIELQRKIDWWHSFLSKYGSQMGSGHSRIAYLYLGFVWKVPHSLPFLDMNRCEAALYQAWCSGLSMGYVGIRPVRSVMMDDVVLIQDVVDTRSYPRGEVSISGGSDGLQGGTDPKGDYVLFDFAQYPNRLRPHVYDMRYWATTNDSKPVGAENTWPHERDMLSREEADAKNRQEVAYWLEYERQRLKRQYADEARKWCPERPEAAAKREAEERRYQDEAWAAESRKWAPRRLEWAWGPVGPMLAVSIGNHDQWATGDGTMFRRLEYEPWIPPGRGEAAVAYAAKKIRWRDLAEPIAVRYVDRPEEPARVRDGAGEIVPIVAPLPDG